MKLKFTILISSLLIITACSDQHQINQMQDYKLKEKIKGCFNLSRPSAEQKALCKLYRQECDRRQDMGRHSCDFELNEGMPDRPVKKLRSWE